MPRKSNLSSRILDADEDGAYHMDVQKKSKTNLAKRIEREIALMDMLTEDKKGDAVDSGAVVLDWSKRIRSNPAYARYWNWQSERAVSKQPARNATTPSHASQSEIGFFALLPGELRNKVYRLALIEEDGVFTIRGHANQCSLGPCTHTKLSLTVPGLLNTCKQIRYESMPIFLSEHVIKFDARTVRCRCTGNFIRSLGPLARFIESVALEIMVWTLHQHIPRHPVPTRAGLRTQQPFEIKIERPASSQRRFSVNIDNVIQAHLWKETQLLLTHAKELDERAEIEEMAQLLLEFVWSDWMAELVYKSEQGRY